MQTENEQGLLRRSDALTLEEIQASTYLTGKIASASALDDTLIKGEFTVIGTTTTLEHGTTIEFSKSLNNFKYFMVQIIQGYDSIVINSPVKLCSHGGRKFSFSHGRPISGTGCQGIILISNTYAQITEPTSVGWNFSSLDIIGVN